MGEMEFRQFPNTLDGGGQPHVSAALPLAEGINVTHQTSWIFSGVHMEKKNCE
jgi:hypothetical protein